MATKKTQAQIEFTANTQGFTEGIKEADASLKTFRKELDVNATKLKGDAESVDLLTERKKILEKQAEASENKINALTNKLEVAKKTFGENSKEVYTLNNSLLDAQKQFAGIQNDIGRTDAKLDQLAQSTNELEKETEDAGDSMKKLKDATDDAGDGFTVAKGALAGFISNGLTALTSAIGNGISSLANLSQETQEYREDIGKLETAWQSAGKSTELATETYKNFYSVLGEEDRSVEAVNHLAKFVETEQDMQKWTDICTGVWGTFGDSLPIEGLTEASNETAKVGKLTGVLADALNWAGVNEDDFQASLDACNSEQERAELITKTLNGLYSEASEHYKENNASIIEARKANSDYTDTMAEMGETLEPVMTSIKEGFTEVLNIFSNLLDGVDMENLSASISSGFKVLTDDVLPALKDGIKWLIDNKETVAVIFTGLIATITAYKWASIVTFIGTLKTAVVGLFAVLSANPIGLIIMGITALVAGIVYLWNNSETFKNFVLSAFEAIKSALSTAWEFIKTVFAGLVEWFNLIKTTATTIFENIKTAFMTVWTSVKEWFVTNIINPLKAFFAPFVQMFTEAFNIVKELAQGVWIAIKAIFGVVSSWFNETVITPVKNAFTTLWNGVKNVAITAWNGIKSVWQTVSSWFTNTIITPVKNTFTSLWNTLKNGATSAWTGIKNVFSPVVSWFKEKFTSAWTAVKNVFSAGGKVFSGIKEGIESAFKTIVNTLIRGVNKVVSVPFNAINNMLDKIKNVSIAGIKPFKNLISRFTVPQIPLLAKGGVVDKATPFIAGEAGAEAVLPLERLENWVNSRLETSVNNAVSYSNARIEDLITVAEKILAKDSNMYVNGRKLSESLGGSTDAVSGERLSLANRGLVL